MLSLFLLLLLLRFFFLPLRCSYTIYQPFKSIFVLISPFNPLKLLQHIASCTSLLYFTFYRFFAFFQIPIKSHHLIFLSAGLWHWHCCCDQWHRWHHDDLRLWWPSLWDWSHCWWVTVLVLRSYSSWDQWEISARVSAIIVRQIICLVWMKVALFRHRPFVLSFHLFRLLADEILKDAFQAFYSLFRPIIMAKIIFGSILTIIILTLHLTN